MQAIRTVVAAFLGLCCLWLGVPGVYVWATNPRPQQMTCADYLARRPPARWVRLTHCDASYFLAACLTQAGTEQVQGYYAPVRPSDATPEDPNADVALVVKAADPEITGLLDKLLPALPDPEGAGEEVVLDHAEKLFGKSTEVQGLVLAGRDDQPAVRAALSGPQNPWRPAPDFILLDAGRAPRLLPGLAWLLGAAVAFAMMGFLVWDRLRRGRPAQARRASGAATPPTDAEHG
jgi:hypothetical protein